ncbi:MAG: phenylalanine--tRNA ligase subunit beta [Sumerlaeia bacterium]
MRFNLRWLRDYIKTDLSLAEIADALTMCGLEVEETIDLGAASGQVVVGKILELKRHPDADKLSVCKVQGDDPEPLQIVCGASNIAVGQHVPLAKLGATLPNGMTLKPTSIRGVASQGMMCSAKELGAAEDSDGIWLLPETMPVGEPFDALIEIGVTPNRPDALSLVGVARDLSAKTGAPVTLPEVKFPESTTSADSEARITVEPAAKSDCPRYCARVIKGVTIGPSPIWMQRRLEAAGLRPRNNVVDVTNYVMLELGHPLHAFDLDTLARKTVVVRRAKPGEKMRLLDDTVALLEPTDLLIADPEKPIALAGIMGGGETEISDGTTNVLLEAAYFHPATIRKTAKRLGKSTDASYRFERGTDARKLTVALHRAAQLIQELAGGQVLQSFIDVGGAQLPKLELIPLRIERFRALTGLNLTGREMSDILQRLGFEIHRVDKEQLVVQAASHRPDVTIEVDLIEEIARIHGYGKIVAKLPQYQMTNEALPPSRVIEDRLTTSLIGRGFCQVVNFAFVSEGANVLAGASDARSIAVLNPLTQDQGVMRRSLVPSLLTNAVHNFNNFQPSAMLFEIGRTYAWKAAEWDEEGEDKKTLDVATDEPNMLCVLLGGEAPGDWRAKDRPFDFYDAKGVAELLLADLGIPRTGVEAVKDVPWLHPGRGAALTKGKTRLAVVGELHPAIAKELDLKKRVYVLEIPLGGDLLEILGETKFKDLPTQMAVKRDLAIVANRTVAAQDIERTIRSAARDLLESVALFDVYEGQGVPEGKRSLAFSLTFRAPDRTLKDDEVNDAVKQCVEALGKRFGAELR